MENPILLTTNSTNKNLTIDPKKYFTLFFFMLLLLSSFSLSAQEICDDGIDNDGDGLIDCADTDWINVAGCEDAFACTD